MDTITNLCNEIAEKIPRVYEKGKKDEHDAFWDVFQSDTRNFFCKYAGNGWTTETFKPKSDLNIVGGNASYCFGYTNCNVDLVEWCEMLGIGITIKPTVMTSMFQSSKFTRLPVIDASNASALSSVFAYCTELVTIDKLILREDGTNTFASAFYDCRALKNIVIEGVIRQNGLNFQWSPLTPESMISIITHLFNFGFDEHVGDRYTCTIKFSDACWNALNEYSSPPDFGNPDGDWRDYLSYIGWNT